jgi:hypothetical protein
VSYLRYYLAWKQIAIVKYLEELTGNEYNGYNLSNHLNFHIDEDEKKFWKNLKMRYPDESSMSRELREALYKRIRKT